jgi:hypothetical protein
VIQYARHFALLGLLTAALAVAQPIAGSLGIRFEFALYGALHAAALALSMVGGARPSGARRLLFIAAAATLALATARLGLFGLRVVGGLGGSGGPWVILAVCAALGALAYGALIRVVLGTPGGMVWSRRSVGATSLGCAAAVSACCAAGRGFHTASPLLLVAPWWFALSGGLWLAGRRRVA